MVAGPTRPRLWPPLRFLRACVLGFRLWPSADSYDLLRFLSPLAELCPGGAAYGFELALRVNICHRFLCPGRAMRLLWPPLRFLRAFVLGFRLWPSADSYDLLRLLSPLTELCPGGAAYGFELALRVNICHRFLCPGRAIRLRV